MAFKLNDCGRLLIVGGTGQHPETFGKRGHRLAGSRGSEEVVEPNGRWNRKELVRATGPVKI